MHLRRRKSTTEVLMEHVQDLTERAGDLGEHAVSALATGAGEARDAATGAYGQVRGRIGIRDRVRSDVVPKAKAVAASPVVVGALAKSAIDRAKPRKKTHRLRNLLVALALGGASFAAARRFGRFSSTSERSYTPPPRPTAVPDPVPAAPPPDDASVGVDPAPPTVPGDGPTMDEFSGDPIGGDPIYPEVGYSEDQPSDDRRPDDAAS